MAKTKISEFSSTPANNTDIDSINIAEGCAPSGINDAIRELMAQLKDFQTGAVGDSFNGPIGASTASTGAFTTLSASSTVSGTGFSTYLASPPAIGGTAAAAVSATTLAASGAVTLSGGTANGVTYLNGSKVVTSGSALTFSSNTFLVDATGTGGNQSNLRVQTDTGGAVANGYFNINGTDYFRIYTTSSETGLRNLQNTSMYFSVNNTEGMRLTSTGLGIGTSSPARKLEVQGSAGYLATFRNNSSTATTSYINVINANNVNAGLVMAQIDDGTGYFGTQNNAALRFVTNDTERARIDTSGNLLVGKTSSDTTIVGAALLPNATAGFIAAFTSDGQRAVIANRLTSDGTLYSMRRSGTEVGTIAVSTVLTTYNTTSDYRLKTVVGAVTNHGERIDALQPVEYTWNSNGTRTRGFLAHQFQEVYASSVTGDKDAVDADGNPVYQSMQASSAEVIADLVAEIQSLRVRVAQLETN